MRLKRRKSSKGKIRNATKIEKDGIVVRSKLELYTYSKLKENKISFEYESTRFVLIDKFTYPKDSYESYKSTKGKKFEKRSDKIRPMTYLPDFINKKDNWVIEVKGYYLNI